MLRYLFNFLFLLTSIGGWSQQSVSVQYEAAQLKKKIQEHHVSPRPVDDTFSAIVFHNLLEMLDPDRIYFTKQDVAELGLYKTKIDDELGGSSWKFLPAITQRFKERLLRAEALVLQHTLVPFDFGMHEILVSDSSWAEHDAALAQRWYLNLKLETLNQLVRLKRNLPNISDKEFLRMKESHARQLTKQNTIRTIKRMVDHPTGFEQHIGSLFLQSLSLGFDPHSSHFTLKEMENYLAAMQSEGFYLGISIDENDHGDLVIGQLTPGGPAWKSGEVHPGDIIEQIRWEGQEWVDVIGMSKEEMEDLLQETDVSTIEFVLVQAGNIQKTVRLRKEKMQVEENIVKSFILEGEKRIGYVSLPGFYSSWGEQEGSRCANDVAKEIIKLKKENIEGLILDVRYNGGGSLYEAVAMAGIFIDAGPMGVLKDKSGAVQSIKDMNRGTVYDGPLVLLVNGLSASASEFLAAALQDYHRGIIVGSQTYGKATGQEIIPVQPGKSKMDATIDIQSGWGFSTITTLKIYRVTGKTAQLHGVTPDIALPDLYDSLEFREHHLAGALPADSVIKKLYYTQLSKLPLQALKQKSHARVARHEGFQVTARCSKKIAALKEQLDSVSLRWMDYKTLVEDEGKDFILLKELNEKSTATYKVTGHAFELQRMQIDEYVRQTNDVWMKNLLHDISLEEAFYIICDYIALNSSK
jgi:carboxyl-terminal processing protease